MSTRPTETSPRLLARVTGFVYLLDVPLVLPGLLSSGLIVPGDAAATANKLIANATLYRLGIVGDLLSTIDLIVVVLLLYQLLKPVNKPMAALMVMFQLVAASISVLNTLPQLAALQLVSDAGFLHGFTTEQVQALALFFLGLNSQGSTIAYIFWGLWLLPMGYVVFRSGFLPRMLGVLLVIACFGYLMESFGTVLGYNVTIAIVTAWGELALPLWLAIRGVNVDQWKKRTLVSA